MDLTDANDERCEELDTAPLELEHDSIRTDRHVDIRRRLQIHKTSRPASPNTHKTPLPYVIRHKHLRYHPLHPLHLLFVHPK